MHHSSFSRWTGIWCTPLLSTTVHLNECIIGRRKLLLLCMPLKSFQSCSLKDWVKCSNATKTKILGKVLSEFSSFMEAQFRLSCDSKALYSLQSTAVGSPGRHVGSRCRLNVNLRSSFVLFQRLFEITWKHDSNDALTMYFISRCHTFEMRGKKAEEN